MRIGLIGINKYAKYLNFACDLHVYAFQRFLAEEGYDSTILDYKPVHYGSFDMRNPAPVVEAEYKAALRQKAGQRELQKLQELAEGYASVVDERARRFDKFDAFAKQNLTFTSEVYDSDLLEVDDPGFDCYICVTDVIWTKLSRYPFDRGFLLGSKAFEGKPKIAYAASRGASKDFRDQDKALFFDYLSDIDAISVREEDLSEYIETNSDRSAPTVIDPVLFHDKEFWSTISKRPEEERYLLLYYVMEQSTDTIAKAVEYAKLHDLTIVELSDRPLKNGKIQDPDVEHVARYDVGMEEWLGYIQYAECLFTNSFHGCCFSLVFEKPLFVGRRNGSKVANFLSAFHLADRQFEPDDDVRLLSPEIDFTRAHAAVERKKEESRAFLMNALAQAEQRSAAASQTPSDEHDRKRRRLQYPVRYRSGISAGPPTLRFPGRDERLKVRQLKSGAVEYWYDQQLTLNDGSSRIRANLFGAPGHAFDGWTMRFRIDNRWFWVLDDGSITPAGGDSIGLARRKAVFPDGAYLPHLPVNHVSVAVLEAHWTESKRFRSRLESPLGKLRTIARRGNRSGDRS